MVRNSGMFNLKLPLVSTTAMAVRTALPLLLTMTRTVPLVPRFQASMRPRTEMFTIGFRTGVPSVVFGAADAGGVAGPEGMVASVGAGVSVVGGVLESFELPELVDGDRVLGVQATINNKIHK
jgi:hypothetical protein